MEEKREEQHIPEVVEIYERRLHQEVVEVYRQPGFLPGRRGASPRHGMAPVPAPILRSPPPAAPARRSRRGLRVFLLCCAAVVVLTICAVLLYSGQEASGERYWDDDRPQFWDLGDEEVHITPYTSNEGVEMPLSRTHGAELTAQEIYALVNPAVVTVMAYLDDSISVGTGIIFREDGYLLTNYHVVAGSDSCTIGLPQGGTLTAHYVGGDNGNDIAILKVNKTGLPTAEIGDSNALTVGDRVYAIGNPLGLELRGTFTDGMVSAINRDVDVQGRVMTLIQTNTALNEGNSGGPLINQYGQVVGINTIKMMSTHSNIEGLGFALPTAGIQRLVNDLLAYGEIQPEPLLGISVTQLADTLPDGSLGVTVLDVTAGSPAALAGVQVQDVIVAADGGPVSSSSDLLLARRQHHLGERMKLRLWRGGEYLTVTLELNQAAE